MARDRGNRGYSRLDRVNHALQEVLGDELELIDDDRLALVTVTGTRVAPDLRSAVVWFSSLSHGEPEEVAATLAEHRVRLQAAVARQLRLRRTPELTFAHDPAIEAGTRVEDILRRLHNEGDASAGTDEIG
jgi:ribosome-binding factor A